MLSCIYLTRACPQHCEYCALRDSKLHRPELSVEEWKHAFDILEKLGVEFHLLLGNELMAKRGIVEIIDYLTNVKKVPYAFYSTFPPELMDIHAQRLVDIGITNVSCGFDTAHGLIRPGTDPDIVMKSLRGLEGICWFRDHGVPDRHLTVTASQINIGHISQLLKIATSEKAWSAVNTIHWDQDGLFDFFPPKNQIEHLLLYKDEIAREADAIRELHHKGQVSLQNTPEYLDAWEAHGADLSWHCAEPMIISVDADGSLRCCGYRRGVLSPELSIFDIERHGISDWLSAWHEDMTDCPGCFWSYWWQAETYLADSADYAFGIKVFQSHASKEFGGFK